VKDEYTVRDFHPGQRVEMHPAADLWLTGARFGTVVKVGTKVVHVKLDKIPAIKRVHPRNRLPAS